MNVFDHCMSIAESRIWHAVLKTLHVVQLIKKRHLLTLLTPKVPLRAPWYNLLWQLSIWCHDRGFQLRRCLLQHLESVWYCPFTDCGTCSREQQCWQVNDVDHSAIIILGSVPIYSPLVRKSNLLLICEVNRAKSCRGNRLSVHFSHVVWRLYPSCNGMTINNFRDHSDACIAIDNWWRDEIQEPQEPHSAQTELLAVLFPSGIRLTISTAWILIALTNSAYYEDVLEERG